MSDLPPNPPDPSSNPPGPAAPDPPPRVPKKAKPLDVKPLAFTLPAAAALRAPAPAGVAKPARQPKASRAPPAKPVRLVLPEGAKIPTTAEPLPVALPAAAHSVPRAALEAFVRRNPHCAQVRAAAACAHFARASDLDDRPIDAIPFFITPESERIPFVERPDADRSTLHFGQLKLLVCELWFLAVRLAACAGKAYTVIYAGAAPGAHIPFLAGLFPACRFVLYDPAPYCKALAEGRAPPNVTVHSAFFDEQTAAGLAASVPDDARVFISDIRTGRNEVYVEGDMARQKEWVRILRPVAALLKFRLPWQAGTTPYVGGDVLLPAFAPLTSTECRLALTRDHVAAPDRAYDNTEYEQACAFHNTVGRVRPYAHGVRVPGLDHCHDCAMLVAVAREYLRRAGRDAGDAGVGAFIESAFEGRTLASEGSRSSNRSRRRFPERSYDGDTFHERRPRGAPAEPQGASPADAGDSDDSGGGAPGPADD